MTYKEFIKRYTFNPETDQLGEGGFGIVYKAYDNYRDTWVAIKQSKFKKEQENFSLQKEVELASKLPDHPNIAHYETCYRFNVPMMGTYDFGILQYYQEGNLSVLRKAGKITNKNLNKILEGILSGIAHLHKHNIIHRDIKPGNILIAKRGNDYIPKITDFGISKQGVASDQSFISNSLAGGTYSYAAPEQLKGETKMRRNADLWSFGVIVYQLMTDKLPFEPTTPDTSSEAARTEVVNKILEGNLPSDIASIAPPHKYIVEQCLVLNKIDRVQTAKELIEILNGNTSTSQDTTPKKTVRTSRDLSRQDLPADKTITEPPVQTSRDLSADKTITEEQNPAGFKNPQGINSTPEKKNKTKILIPIAAAIIGIILAFIIFGKPSEENRWQTAQEHNTSEAYEQYLADYPQGTFTEQAQENLAWLQTKQENTTAAYNKFKQEYPQSNKLNDAENEIQKLQLDSTLALNNTQSLRAYIQQYPQGNYTEKTKIKLDVLVQDSIKNAKLYAQDKAAYDKAKRKNTESAYQTYINNYPQGQYLKEAKQQIVYLNNEELRKADDYAWKKAKRTGTKESYQTYINNYPQGQYLSQAKTAIKNIGKLPEIEMVYVRGGTFQMGSNNGESDEKPVHSVTLSGYYIGKYEVTQKLWKAVMGNNPSRFKGDNRPVEKVSWNDIQTFLKKLNSMTGKHYRLPTEAQWEFAARGGNKSRGYKYAGGNSIGSVAWYSGNSGSKTHNVGGKNPNELGIYDMSGNVWEWCRDWYSSSYYSTSPSKNPKGASNGSLRVSRSGSWYNRAEGCRSAGRDYDSPDYRYNNMGFRLCR